MEILVANLSGKIRRERHRGRNYLVAPATILVSGVLNGSEGPIFYPPEEIERNPSEWNATPIVVNHPMVGGKYVSARDPDILEKYGIGFLYRSVASNGKGSAEAWFDEEDTRRVDPRILNALEAGTPIELSTSLLAIKEPKDGVYNGIPYKFIARGYRSDHLAVLPDGIGACSIAAGCGILVNESDKKTLWQKLGEMLGIGTSPEPVVTPGGNNTPPVATPVVANTEEAQVNKAQLVDWLIANCDCWKHAGDKEVLLTMSEQKLLKLKEGAEKAARAEEVAEAARKGFESGTERHVFNQTTGRWESSPKPSPPPAAPVATPVENATRLSAEEQEDLAFARQERTRQKEQLIGQLIANVTGDAERKAKADWLRTQSMTTLQQMVGLLPPAPTADPNGGGSVPYPRYDGAAAPVGNAGRSQDDVNDFLPLPKRAWETSGTSGGK